MHLLSYKELFLLKILILKTKAKISLIASFGSGMLAYSYDFKFWSWSLVVQQISRQFLLSFFMWVHSKWRPQLSFSIESFKELFGFGSKILISQCCKYFLSKFFFIDHWKIYSTEQLGKFTRVSNLIQFLPTILLQLYKK
jgi:O-antigen/teichoic acid export membrane protein